MTRLGDWGSARDRRELDNYITRADDDLDDDLDEAGYDGPVPAVGSGDYNRLSPNHPARILADRQGTCPCGLPWANCAGMDCLAG